MPNIGTTGKLILAFVTLLLGAVLIAQVATQGNLVTAKTTKFDESHSISSIREGAYSVNTTTNVSLTAANQINWKTEDCPITNLNITNSSGREYVLNTDYNANLVHGTFNFLNTSQVFNGTADNNTLADFTYCGDDYLNSSFGRSGVNLVPGFFALAILLVSVGLFFSVAKDYGII